MDAHNVYYYKFINKFLVMLRSTNIVIEGRK